MKNFSREEVLDQAKKDLLDLYDKYKTRGIEAVYLWGSILNEDYNPNFSDVDSIAFVKPDTPLELEEELISHLKDADVKDLKIRFIYRDEFEKDVQKGNLVFYIPAQLLLLDFPFWEYVAGRKFSRSDFLLPDISLQESICLRIESMEKDQTFVYKVKKVAQVCHTIYELEHGKLHYSHEALKNRTTPQTEKIILKLLKLRENQYDNNDLEEARSDIDEFLNKVKSKYCR